MKIGDVEIKRVPAGENIPCENGCTGKAVAYYNGTPYCAECLREEQQRKWDADGNFFVDSEGEEVRFEVVNHFSVNVPLDSQ